MATLTVSITDPVLTTRYLKQVDAQTDIDKLKIDVEELQTETETNTNDISTLSSQVETNTTNISNLSSQVQTNTTNISNLSSLSSQVQTNTNNISSLSSQVQTNTTNISNLTSEVQTITNEMSSLDILTMNDIKENLEIHDNVDLKNFVIKIGEIITLDTKTTKLNLNDYITEKDDMVPHYLCIAFYKNENNKMCGFCFFYLNTWKKGAFLDNSGNQMYLYMINHYFNQYNVNKLIYLYDSNDVKLPFNIFSTNDDYLKWNYINVFFDESYSEILIKAFFGDNVNINDIHCTNKNDYFRETGQSREDSSAHPLYEFYFKYIDYDPYLLNQVEEPFYSGLTIPSNYIKFTVNNVEYNSSTDSTCCFNINKYHYSDEIIPNDTELHLYVAFGTTSNSNPLLDQFYILCVSGNHESTDKLSFPLINNSYVKWYEFDKAIEKSTAGENFNFYWNNQSYLLVYPSYLSCTFQLKLFSFPSSYHDDILKTLFGKLDSTVDNVECKIVSGIPEFLFNTNEHYVNESGTLSYNDLSSYTNHIETTFMTRLKRIIKMISN